MATCPTCRANYPEDQSRCPEDDSELLPDVAFASADPELQPGTPVGEYEVVGKIGQGGFGAVYEAVHPLIGKRVAIKVLKRAYSSDPESASRFIAEARAVNQIQHRYIIDIFSFGQTSDGRHYYIMDLLDGEPLDDYLAALAPLAPEAAIPILRAIAEAVDAAHAAGIAHRDLKPDNVFVTRDGGIQLLDFGIAKLMTGDTVHKTKTGAIMGTPLYMSPEQVRGRGVDHRTDFYAFGVIAFEMLTGKRPFTGSDVMEILFQHMTEAPPVPSEVNPALPAALDAPILHLLEKEADNRPESLTAAIHELEEAARTAGVDVPPTLSAVQLSAGVPARAGSKLGAMADLAPTVNATPAHGAAALGASSTSVLLGAEATSSLREDGLGGRPRWLLAAGAAVAIAAVVSAVVLVRGQRTSGGATAGAGDPALGQVAAGTPDAAPVPGVATAGRPGADAASPGDAAVDAAPALPATVVLRVDGPPAGTEVHGPDGALGTVPGEIELPRGDAPIALTFKRRGYLDATQSVTPQDDVRLLIQMRKRPSRPARPPRQKTDPDSLPGFGSD